MNDKMKAKCYRLDYNELGLSTLCVEKDKEIESLKEDNNELRELLEYKNDKIERLHSVIKEISEKVDSFDVFKEFTFPLMKRDVEQQVKSSIDYEWRKSIKEPILEILDKVSDK